ncbi:lipase family protein [Zooshikella sp. RANM57]|uniref:lipase family protein n=1 Tax=Zooshikella sp. RANM57 TaxID=3425863 RepID=UPI003D6DCCB1
MNNAIHGALAHLCVDVQAQPTITHNDFKLLVKSFTHCQALVVGYGCSHFLYKQQKMLRGWQRVMYSPGWYWQINNNYKQFNEQQRYLLPLLTNTLDRSKPVVLAGHSTGASISLMLAEVLIKHNFIIQEWVGFGCPRMYKGQQYWQGFPLTSYQYGNDIVPLQLPFKWPFQQPVKLTKVGCGFNIKPNWGDHQLENYVNVLN